MSYPVKKIAILAAAALMICSCSSPDAVIIDHGISETEQSEASATIHTQPIDAEPDEQIVSAAAAIVLPDEIAVADPIPISAELFAENEVEEPPAPAVTSTNAYMLTLSSKAPKYSYEQQKSNGSMTILGPNMVYVGEQFDFSISFPDADKDTNILWTVLGSGGKITKDGRFTAISRSVCTLIATDQKSGVYSSMRVHCIESTDNIDFIPLVNGIPIANKSYPLPKDYDPGLDPTTRAAFLRMQADAKKSGLNIYPISAYRSYSYQQKVYSGWVNMYGNDADLISARPGHSEHQLGLAIDVNSLEYSFENTAEGKWLKKHCAEYGFIIRYPSHESKKYTGYSFEPWHIRYVGKSLAKTVTSSGKTLEEILGIDSYYR